MHLFVDESGNTGETLSKDYKFNFADQPIYVLAAILPGEKHKLLLEFTNELLKQHKVKSGEIKARNVYEKKPRFIIDLIDHLTANKIPCFIELMDKLYYLNIQLTTYFISPLPPINDPVIARNNHIASTLSEYLTIDIYQSFIKTCKDYTAESLEHFYLQLIDHFDSIDHYEYKGYVQLIQTEYFDYKRIDASKALRGSLPLPDLNPHQRWLHLLPNFNAFTGLVGRVQKHKAHHKIERIDILHDEQKQFDSIYIEALNSMRNIDNDSFIKDSKVKETTSLNIEDNISLKFDDSKLHSEIQIADLLAGFAMRFWLDFNNEVEEKVDMYFLSFIKLAFYDLPPSAGINFVVPDAHYQRLMFCASFNARLNDPNVL